MFRRLLKSRIHKLTVTANDGGAEDAIVVDRELLRKADLWPFEQVDVINYDNGARFSSCVIEAEAGSGIVAVNGGASHLARIGQSITIAGYVFLAESDVPKYYQRVVQVDSKNRAK